MPKIKKIFVGTNQVRPVYNYSYDFRNKTTTNLTNDGWTIVKGTPTFNSDGVTGSDIRITRSINTSTANKITISLYANLESTSAFAARISKSVTESGTTGNTGSYITAGQNKREVNIYGTSTSFSGISSGTYTQTVIFDFANKTWTLSTTGKSDQTGTLTDTQISNIKNETSVIYVYSGGTGGGLSTYSIKIEY